MGRDLLEPKVSLITRTDNTSLSHERDATAAGSEWFFRTTRMRRTRQISSKSERSSDREDGKNSSEFFEATIAIAPKSVITV
jgi:hypothetical protein